MIDISSVFNICDNCNVLDFEGNNENWFNDEYLLGLSSK